MAGPIDTYTRALAAYGRLAGGGEPAAGGPAEPAGRSSFAEMLKDVAGGALTAGRSAEAASVSAASGRGDLSQVVTAVSEAEMTLQTVVAVRERVIDAYKEILRMPI